MIINQIITPAFKTGDYNQGISDGVGAILQVLGGTPLADDAAAWQDLSVLLDEFPGAGFSAAEVEAVLAEIGPPPTADAATGDGETDGTPDADATDGGAATES